MKTKKKELPELTCLARLRSAPGAARSLIMGMSPAHAREIATDMKRRGYAAVQCGRYVRTDAPFQTSRRAHKR